MFTSGKDLDQKPQNKKKLGWGQICIENRYRPLIIIHPFF